MAFEYLRKINYYETDKMGIVHHSNYIRFLEEARCRWLEEKGISMELLEDKGYTIPTLEVNCKYKNPVTSGDVISIIPKISEYNGVKMTITYEVTNKETGKVVIDAYTKHCFTNRELRPINIKKYDETINKVFEEL
ncbi:MAG: acyl-CoA thioesterase [Clostridia bacterium]|nr:acyl-CoA thioesterase [Clostridia bacterium]